MFEINTDVHIKTEEQIITLQSTSPQDELTKSFYYREGPKFFHETFGANAKLFSCQGEEIVNLSSLTSPKDLKKGWKVAVANKGKKKGTYGHGGSRPNAGRKPILKCNKCRASHRRCPHVASLALAHSQAISQTLSQTITISQNQALTNALSQTLSPYLHPDLLSCSIGLVVDQFKQEVGLASLDNSFIPQFEEWGFNP